MISIERLIREHSAIATLTGALSLAAPDGDGASLRAKLVRLDMLLRAHLATEDFEVYPLLLAKGDSSQRLAASSAMSDFDTLAADWRNYADHWTQAEIVADRAGFVEDSAIVLSALSGRIQIENEVLYPLALRNSTISLREAATALD